jgi:NADPH-dependent curcumin reductase
MTSDGLVPPYTLPDANRQVLLVRRPSGIPTRDDFALAENRVPQIGDGQILVRNIFLSVDPAQRGWAADTANYSAAVAIGSVMRALAVGVVVESRDKRFAAGSFVYGTFGWQVYAAATAADVLTSFAVPVLPLAAYAGLLGINGLTADIALAKYSRISPGETVLVSTAAGAVGSLVGQLARQAGARTIGLTGSETKRVRLLERFGFAVGLNYREADLAAALDAAAPDGFDLYFDNVGGPILDLALRRMKTGGRVIQCGTASIDRWSPPPTGPRNEREILTRRLTWQGFVIFDHRADLERSIARLQSAALAGDLRYDQQILEGLDEAPGALELLYAGRNKGKLVISLD